MNITTLVGNLTKDPETQELNNGVKVAKFTVAVTRRFKEDGEYKSDFINCVAWRNTAEFIEKYFKKGSKIGLVGSLQTRTYDAQDGTKRYVSEVIVDTAEFVDSKNSNNSEDDKKVKLIKTDDDNLPF